MSDRPRANQARASAVNGPPVTVAGAWLNQISQAVPECRQRQSTPTVPHAGRGLPAGLTRNGPTRNITQTVAKSTISGTTSAAA